MSRSHGWKPKPKFTAGLNVSQDEWDRIFKKPKKLPASFFLPKTENKLVNGKWTVVDKPPSSQSRLTNPHEESNSNS